MILSPVLLSIFFPAAALYDSKSDVVKLTASNFDDMVTKSVEPWIVEFYAPWCGHCKSFAPEYSKAATALKGIVRLGAVEDESLMPKFGVQGFPTVKFFGDNKNKPEDYNQDRSASALVDFAVSKVKKITKDRLAGKSKPAGETKGGKKASGPSKVVVLTDGNFDKMVMKDEKSVWMVEFYAPWCGHCKALEPTYEEVAADLDGKVKVAKVDATTETVLAKRFGIQGFPSIKLFPAGKKADSLVVPYEADRSKASLVAWGMKFHSMSIEAEQLLSQKMLEDNCSSQLCIIAFLPHVLDSGAAGRNKYLEDFNLSIRASAGVPVHYLWTQGGDQFDMEEALRLQFGFPAVVAMHLEKGKYGIHRGAFNQEALRQFVEGLKAGQVPLEPLPSSLPKIVPQEAWDGKDMVIEEEPLDYDDDEETEGEL